MAKITLPWLMGRITDEPSAYLFLEQMRWGDNPYCPHCHSTNVRFIRPLDGASRKTRTGSMSKRRVWKCRDCTKQFSVLTGTVFHGTKISIRTWVFVVFEMCASKNGVAAREIERKYGVTNKTAWFMLHRIRAAMEGDGLAGMLGGNGNVVVADETFFGGSLSNKSNSERKRIRNGLRPGPFEGKTAVLSLVDTATGEVRSKVVPDVAGPTLRKAIAEQVNMADTVLYTDTAAHYRGIAKELLAHEAVNHSEGQYARYKAGKVITTNQIEGFFSQLKRSIDGTHHHVSAKHLHRYLGEFDFRYSTRSENDGERFTRLLGQVAGVRLSWRPLTGI